MSPSSNEDLYPQYKKDTYVVAQWLKETSNALGFTRSRDTRHRTKAKKQYTISIAEFGHMADFLSLKESVSVPGYIWTSLSRAIRYRSSYGNYLQQQRYTNTPHSRAGDQQHLFFIDVLKNVRNILDRAFNSSTPFAPPTASLASLDISRQATVEDDVENDAKIPTPASKSLESSNYDVIFEPWKEDDEEAMFHWRLFNVDVQRIRKQICQIWELYRTGHLSLSGAATAHNMAIHVVWKMEQDIQPVFERYGGYLKLSKENFIQRYVGTAKDEEERRARVNRLRLEDRVKITVEAIIDGFNIAEEEMFFASQVLMSEVMAWATCGDFTFYSGKFGPFIPRDDRLNMTGLEKYNQDKALACLVVVDLQVLTSFLKPSSICRNLDELSKAIEDLVPWKFKDLKKRLGKQFPPSYGKITFRAVFATQLVLDSAHILGTGVDRPWRELLDKTARISKSAKSLREFYEGAGSPALGPLAGPSCVEDIEEITKFWHGKEDPISKLRRQAKGETLSKTLRENAETSLRYNAPLCGWWLQTVQSDWHIRSFEIVNSIALPLACAQLYHVFVQEGLVPKGSWPDIEAFSILHQGALWVGIPTNSSQYLTNLMVAGGNSIRSLASDARAKPHRFLKERVKVVTCSTTVSEKIFTAFVNRKAQGLSEDDIERILADTRLRWYNGKAVRPCFHHGWAKAGNHKGDKNPASLENDNPFLRLAQAIDVEALEQSFDYMSLNRVCWMVLQELLKEAQPILDAVKTPDNAKPDWSTAEGRRVHLVVALIFFVLFRPNLPTPKKEASAVADILINLTKGLGRIVHTSTGINWDEALKCSCDVIPS